MMEEKLIREWRIVENEDGFRIEIKGDKESMRDWINTIGPRSAQRRARRWKRFGAWGPMFGHFGRWPSQPDDAQDTDTQ